MSFISGECLSQDINEIKNFYIEVERAKSLQKGATSNGQVLNDEHVINAINLSLENSLKSGAESTSDESLATALSNSFLKRKKRKFPMDSANKEHNESDTNLSTVTEQSEDTYLINKINVCLNTISPMAKNKNKQTEKLKCRHKLRQTKQIIQQEKMDKKAVLLQSKLDQQHSYESFIEDAKITSTQQSKITDFFDAAEFSTLDETETKLNTRGKLKLKRRKKRLNKHKHDGVHLRGVEEIGTKVKKIKIKKKVNNEGIELFEIYSSDSGDISMKRLHRNESKTVENKGQERSSDDEVEILPPEIELSSRYEDAKIAQINETYRISPVLGNQKDGTEINRRKSNDGQTEKLQNKTEMRKGMDPSEIVDVLQIPQRCETLCLALRNERDEVDTNDERNSDNDQTQCALKDKTGMKNSTLDSTEIEDVSSSLINEIDKERNNKIDSDDEHTENLLKDKTGMKDSTQRPSETEDVLQTCETQRNIISPSLINEVDKEIIIAIDSDDEETNNLLKDKTGMKDGTQDPSEIEDVLQTCETQRSTISPSLLNESDKEINIRIIESVDKQTENVLKDKTEMNDSRQDSSETEDGLQTCETQRTISTISPSLINEIDKEIIITIDSDDEEIDNLLKDKTGMKDTQDPSEIEDVLQTCETQRSTISPSLLNESYKEINNRIDSDDEEIDNLLKDTTGIKDGAQDPSETEDVLQTCETQVDAQTENVSKDNSVMKDSTQDPSVTEYVLETCETQLSTISPSLFNESDKEINNRIDSDDEEIDNLLKDKTVIKDGAQDPSEIEDVFQTCETQRNTISPSLSIEIINNKNNKRDSDDHLTQCLLKDKTEMKNNTTIPESEDITQIRETSLVGFDQNNSEFHDWTENLLWMDEAQVGSEIASLRNEIDEDASQIENVQLAQKKTRRESSLLRSEMDEVTNINNYVEEQIEDQIEITQICKTRDAISPSLISELYEVEINKNESTDNRNENISKDETHMKKNELSEIAGQITQTCETQFNMSPSQRNIRDEVEINKNVDNRIENSLQGDTGILIFGLNDTGIEDVLQVTPIRETEYSIITMTNELEINKINSGENGLLDELRKENDAMHQNSTDIKSSNSAEIETNGENQNFDNSLSNTEIIKEVTSENLENIRPARSESLNVHEKSFQNSPKKSAQINIKIKMKQAQKHRKKQMESLDERVDKSCRIAKSTEQGIEDTTLPQENHNVLNSPKSIINPPSEEDQNHRNTTQDLDISNIESLRDLELLCSCEDDHQNCKLKSAVINIKIKLEQTSECDENDTFGEQIQTLIDKFNDSYGACNEEDDFTLRPIKVEDFSVLENDEGNQLQIGHNHLNGDWLNDTLIQENLGNLIQEKSTEFNPDENEYEHKRLSTVQEENMNNKDSWYSTQLHELQENDLLDKLKKKNKENLNEPKHALIQQDEQHLHKTKKKQLIVEIEYLNLKNISKIYELLKRERNNSANDQNAKVVTSENQSYGSFKESTNVFSTPKSIKSSSSETLGHGRNISEKNEDLLKASVEESVCPLCKNKKPLQAMLKETYDFVLYERENRIREETYKLFTQNEKNTSNELKDTSIEEIKLCKSKKKKHQEEEKTNDCVIKVFGRKSQRNEELKDTSVEETMLRKKKKRSHTQANLNEGTNNRLEEDGILKEASVKETLHSYKSHKKKKQHPETNQNEEIKKFLVQEKRARLEVLEGKSAVVDLNANCTIKQKDVLDFRLEGKNNCLFFLEKEDTPNEEDAIIQLRKSKKKKHPNVCLNEESLAKNFLDKNNQFEENEELKGTPTEASELYSHKRKNKSHKNLDFLGRAGDEIETMLNSHKSKKKKKQHKDVNETTNDRVVDFDKKSKSNRTTEQNEEIKETPVEETSLHLRKSKKKKKQRTDINEERKGIVFEENLSKVEDSMLHSHKSKKKKKQHTDLNEETKGIVFEENLSKVEDSMLHSHKSKKKKKQHPDLNEETNGLVRDVKKENNQKDFEGNKELRGTSIKGVVHISHKRKKKKYPYEEENPYEKTGADLSQEFLKNGKNHQGTEELKVEGAVHQLPKKKKKLDANLNEEINDYLGQDFVNKENTVEEIDIYSHKSKKKKKQYSDSRPDQEKSNNEESPIEEIVLHLRKSKKKKKQHPDLNDETSNFLVQDVKVEENVELKSTPFEENVPHLHKKKKKHLQEGNLNEETNLKGNQTLFEECKEFVETMFGPFKKKRHAEEEEETQQAVFEENNKLKVVAVDENVLHLHKSKKKKKRHAEELKDTHVEEMRKSKKKNQRHPDANPIGEIDLVETGKPNETEKSEDLKNTSVEENVIQSHKTKKKKKLHSDRKLNKETNGCLVHNFVKENEELKVEETVLHIRKNKKKRKQQTDLTEEPKVLENNHELKEVEEIVLHSRKSKSKKKSHLDANLNEDTNDFQLQSLKNLRNYQENEELKVEIEETGLNLRKNKKKQHPYANLNEKTNDYLTQDLVENGRNTIVEELNDATTEEIVRHSHKKKKKSRESIINEEINKISERRKFLEDNLKVSTKHKKKKFSSVDLTNDPNYTIKSEQDVKCDILTENVLIQDGTEGNATDLVEENLVKQKRKESSHDENCDPLQEATNYHKKRTRNVEENDSFHTDEDVRKQKSSVEKQKNETCVKKETFSPQERKILNLQHTSSPVHKSNNSKKQQSSESKASEDENTDDEGPKMDILFVNVDETKASSYLLDSELKEFETRSNNSDETYSEKFDINHLPNKSDETEDSDDDLNDSEGYMKILKKKILKERTLANKYDFLRNLHVKVDWDVPPLHCIETRISSRPTNEQREAFDKLNVKTKIGNYTRVEDDMIKRNFEEFCKRHNLPHDPRPFLNVRFAKSNLLNTRDRQRFVQYIGKGLNDRLLWRIYKRFQVIFSKTKKGRFEKTENEIIMKYMQEENTDINKFSTLAKILNRPRLAIEKRYRTMMEKSARDPTQRKNIRNIDIQLFVNAVMKAAKVKELIELKNRLITMKEWKKVSEKTGFSVHNLQLLWTRKVHNQLFIGKRIDISKCIWQIIDKLIADDADDYRSLNWKNIAKDFDGYTHQSLYYNFNRVVFERCPQEIRTNLKECLKYLKNNFSNVKLLPDIPAIIIKEGSLIY